MTCATHSTSTSYIKRNAEFLSSNNCPVCWAEDGFNPTPKAISLPPLSAVPLGAARAFPAGASMRGFVNAGFAVTRVTRTDVNGSAVVRLPQGFLPRTGAFTFDDFEAAAGHVSYTFRGAGTSSLTIAAHMTFDSPWLTVPMIQTQVQPIGSVLSYDSEVNSRASVHEPPGRKDAIVVLRKRGLRRGSLELWAGSHRDAQGVLGLIDQGEVLMIRQPEHAGLDMYFVAESARVDTLTTEEDLSLFSVTMQYIEVARPYGYLLAAPAWNFEQLASERANFDEISALYPDFKSLADNEAP